MGLHAGCLVTTNPLKMLDEREGTGLYFFDNKQSKGGFSVAASSHVERRAATFGGTRMFHDGHPTPPKKKREFRNSGSACVCVCVSYLRRVYLVTLSMLDPCHVWCFAAGSVRLFFLFWAVLV